MPVYFATELEGVATFWRIYRRDGVTLGFTSHDRDLTFEGIRHRAAPGMQPSAIRLSDDLSADSAEVEGALSHDAISQRDLSAGLFDAAQIQIGAVNWETLEHDVLYSGHLGQVEFQRGNFTAELKSAKSLLEQDLVPRTSPTCRAEFCGPQCKLPASKFSSIAVIAAIDHATNTISVAGIDPALFIDGQVRFLDGSQCGLVFGIIQATESELVLDRPIDAGMAAGMPAILRQGCDHTLATCSARFGNTINFRGEPFLPGNDLVARYAVPK